MSDSNDISRLYRQFGGDPEQYQEIGRTNQAIASREKWPLLAAIQPGQGFVPPAVGAEPADSALPQTTWPPVATMRDPSMLFPIEPAAVKTLPARMEPFTAAMAANQANAAAQDSEQPAPSLQSVFARLAKPPRHDVRAETGLPLSKLAKK